jgi:hypothetical protein
LIFVIPAEDVSASVEIGGSPEMEALRPRTNRRLFTDLLSIAISLPLVAQEAGHLL